MKINIKSISYKNLKTCRYLLRFSYIGTKYKGLQRQTKRDELVAQNDGSVQYQMENAIETQLRPIYGARLGISSRTDRGVHAIVNTAHVDLTHPYINTIFKPSFVTQSVNNYLMRSEEEIRLLSTQLVPNGFNARSAVKWRTYCYRLVVVDEDIDVDNKCLDLLLPINELNKCYIIKGPLNVEEMRQVVDLFKGCHDFATFSPKPEPIGDRLIVKDTVKTILEFNLNQSNRLNTITEDMNGLNRGISLWTFEIKCKSFLYNQIRRMVGSIVDVGLNRFGRDRIEWLLQNPSYKNWSFHQTIAPAKGLWLTDVCYDESDLKLINDFGEENNPLPNSYPNYKEISRFDEDIN